MSLSTTRGARVRRAVVASAAAVILPFGLAACAEDEPVDEPVDEEVVEEEPLEEEVE